MRRIFFLIGVGLLFSISGLLFLSWQAGKVMPKRKEVRYDITDSFKK